MDAVFVQDLVVKGGGKRLLICVGRVINSISGLWAQLLEFNSLLTKGKARARAQRFAAGPPNLFS